MSSLERQEFRITNNGYKGVIMYLFGFLLPCCGLEECITGTIMDISCCGQRIGGHLKHHNEISAHHLLMPTLGQNHTFYPLIHLNLKKVILKVIL